MLFFVVTNKNVFFLKKSCNCLPVTLKRSNFASRLLSAQTMGIRYFRSLSMPRMQSSQLVGCDAKRVSLVPISVRSAGEVLKMMELLTFLNELKWIL